jgi:hypothetical protein
MTVEHSQQSFGTVIGAVSRRLIDANFTDQDFEQPPLIEDVRGRCHVNSTSHSSSSMGTVRGPQDYRNDAARERRRFGRRPS